MNREVLAEADQFKNLGSAQTTDETSIKETEIIVAQAHYKSLVLSILLYGCESWTLTATLKRRIKAFENKCYRRMLGISYRKHEIRNIQCSTKKTEPLHFKSLSIVDQFL